MPTILQLFKNQPYQSFGNKTAEEVFEVRNSKKDIEITSTNAILNNTSFKIVKLARRNLSSRLRETRLEEEVTGVRVIRGLSEPVLYGTEYPRLLKRTTNILDSMKNDAVGGDEESNGILGNALNKVEQKGKDLLDKIGAKYPKLIVQFPDKLIPTKIKLNDDFKKGTVSELPTTLAKIKNDGAGNILGKFLAKGVSGTPNQIGNQLLGNGISTAKDAVRKKLFGARKEGANNLASADGIQYNETTKYSNTIDATNEDITQRNDLTSVYEESLQKVVDTLANFGLAAKQEVSLEKVEKQRYSQSENILSNKQKFSKLGDFLNNKVPFATEDGTTPTNAINEILDDYDFITLKFFSLAKKTAVNFRATISGLSETLSPSWQSQKTIGNPFSFYTYDGIERSVQFNFKIYSLNKPEHRAAWERLNFLAGLVYPQGSNGVFITPPFLKFTLGDWYKNKECFIDSLSFSVDDNTPWDIVNDGYKLPTIIEASITLKLVESMGSTFKVETNTTVDADGKEVKSSKLVMNRLYAFGNVDSSTESKEQKAAQLNADSSAKPEDKTVQTQQVSDGTSEKKEENPIKVAPTPQVPPTIRVDVFGTTETGFTANYFDTTNNKTVNTKRNKYAGYYSWNQLEGKEAVFADAKQKAEWGWDLEYSDGTRVPATTSVVRGL